MPDGSDAPPPTSWWQPQNWSLRVKLGVVVLVPVVLAVALGVLRIADQAGVANDLAKVDRVVTAQGQVSELLRQLEAEREIAAGYVAANRQGDLSRYDQQAAAVDGTAGPLDQVVHDVGVDATTAAGAEAGAALRTLADVRGQVRSSGLGAGAVIARYNDVVNPLVRLTDSLSRQIVAPEVGNLAAGVRALVVARNEASLQHSLTIAALTNPVPARQDVALVQGADARYGEAISQYQAALNRQQLDTYGQYSNSPVEATRTQLVNQLANLPDAEPIDRAVLDRTFTDLRAELDKGERGVRGELSSTGLALQNDASNSAGISSVILLLALLLAALVVVLVARVLVRSLRTLRAAALDVANRRLPESVAAIRAGSGARPTVVPVPLRTTDEVGQVARAFDAVHGQAIALASEQAALQSNVSSMFVNLSRRSQALVERQLQLIEQLESNEQDADQLSNLFQLDHLATRMRRNSENLLVLAGTNLTRRNTAPVPLVDVLRAAVSEIEQYQRIVVQTPPTATVQGRVASDVVHLLAELLDNATNFSPPSSQVVMTTNRTPEGAIVVEIVDRGVGMVPNELTEANAQLSGPTTVDLNVSRRMGLFVVGRLSNRHGIKVALSTSSGAVPDAGVTATIALPAELIPTSEPSESITRPAPRPIPAGAEPAQVASNGNGVSASLSALVAGTDGTASGSLFAVPATNGVPTAAPAPSLPSRRPGSTLNPGGPPRKAADPAAQAAADQAAAREAEERLRARRPDGPSDLPPADGPDAEQPAASAEQPEQEPRSAQQQSEEATAERAGGAVAGSAIAGATAFGAAAAFGRGTRAATEQSREPAGSEQLTGADSAAGQVTGAQPAVAATGQSTELPPARPVEQATEQAAERPSGAPAPLPRRTPTTGPTLAEQYGMGRYAPGRTEQPSTQESTGSTLPRRRPQQPQHSPQQQPQSLQQPQQPQQAQLPQQPGTDAYAGGSGQFRSAPRQFLAGLFGTGRPTGPNDSGERPATAASAAGSTAARPATPMADETDQNTATTPLPLVSRQPRLPEARQAPQRPAGRQGPGSSFGAADPSAGPRANAERPAVAETAASAPNPMSESDGPRVETPPTETPDAVEVEATDIAVEQATTEPSVDADQPVADGPAAESPAADEVPARAATVDVPEATADAQPADAPAAEGRPRVDGPAVAPTAQIGGVPISPLPQRIPSRPVAPRPAVAPAPSDGDANRTEALPLIGAGPAPNTAAPVQATPPPAVQPAAAPPPVVQPPVVQPPVAQPPVAPPLVAPRQPAAAANGNGAGEAAAPAPAGGALFAESFPTPQVTPVPMGSDGPGLGETTPIFEEIASAWFRSNRSVPVTWDTDPQPAPSNGTSTWQAPQPKPAPRPTPTSTNGGNGFMHVPAPQQPSAAMPSAAQPFQEQHTAFQDQPFQERQLTPAADAGFASPADEGWRRADDVTSEGAEEVTSAGLPKRRPRARLVPGSAGSAVLAAPAAAARSNDNIRGRLSSYQRGVQQGRTGSNRDDASDRFPGRPTPGDHDEESS